MSSSFHVEEDWSGVMDLCIGGGLVVLLRAVNNVAVDEFLGRRCRRFPDSSGGSEEYEGGTRGRGR